MRTQKFAKRLLGWAVLGALLLTASVGFAQAPETMGMAVIENNTFPPMDLDGDGKEDQVTLLFQGGQNGQEAIFQLILGNGSHYAFILGKGRNWQITAMDAADLTGEGARNIVLMANYENDLGELFAEPFILRLTPAGIFAMTLPVLEDGRPGYAFDITFGLNHTLDIEGRSSNFLMCAPLQSARVRALYTPDGYIADTVCKVGPFTSFEVVPYGDGEYALSLYQRVTCDALEEPVGEMVSTLIWRSGANNLAYQLVAQEFVEGN